MKIQNRSESGDSEKTFKIFGAVAVGLFAFGTTAFLAPGFIAPHESHAESDISAIIEEGGGYYINSSSSLDTIQLNLETTPSGAMTVAKDTINVKSNAPSGYQVYVAMGRDNTCVSNCNALNKTADDTAAATLPATSGTFAVPAVMDSNSWGWAIAKGTSGAPENSFSATYSTTVPDPTTLWASMPVKGEDQLIQTVTTPNSTDGVDVDIYYGINANMSQLAGTYTGTVAYTTVAKTASSVSDVVSITPAKTTKIDGGEAMTIKTLYNITPAQAKDTSGTNTGVVSVKIGGEDCTDVALSQYGTDNYLQITCKAPAHATGKYAAEIVIENYSKDITISNALQYYAEVSEIKNLCESTTFTGFSGTDNVNPPTVTIPTGYYSGTTCNLGDVIGHGSNTGKVYTAQYDSSASAADNTNNAGLTWNDDNTVLTIEEGYHPEQQVNSQSSSRDCLHAASAAFVADKDYSYVMASSMAPSNWKAKMSYSTQGEILRQYCSTAGVGCDIIIKNAKIGDTITMSNAGYAAYLACE